MSVPSTPPTVDIWHSRIKKELLRLLDQSLLPTGIFLHDYHLNEKECKFSAHFHCHVPLPEGSTALGLIPLVVLQVQADCQMNYPFEAPVVFVEEGIQFLPPSMVNLSNKNLTPLPQIVEWTPSQTIISFLVAFVEEVQKHDPQSTTFGTSKSHKIQEDNANAIPIAQIQANLFLCHEVLPNRLVHQVYVGVTDETLLILRLHRTKPNHVVILKECLLCQIIRINFKANRSITIRFGENEPSCTFFTSDSQKCVRLIQEKLKNMGVEGESKTHQDNEVEEDMLKVASERAKEMSKKMYEKIGNYTKPMASAFSKFFGSNSGSNSDMYNGEGYMEVNPLVVIKSLERKFTANPSVVHLKELTESYRKTIEKFGKTNDPRLEQTLVDQHIFLKRSDVQTFLKKVSAQEKRQ